MTHTLSTQPLTAAAFAPFGEVIEVSGTPDKIINQGMCGRHHDLATLDFADGRVGISLFDAKARTFPYSVDMVERHPDGSQAFIPVSGTPMLVVVAEDRDGVPVNLRAFVSQPGQSINLHRGVWHGVLAPIEKPGQFIVIDRIGDGPNLQEHWFDDPYIVQSV
ncbi:ureidoglycolate lyase [Aliiroseovarius zhejiangensis]|uniref:Ureidoglycolate lyase n=1 Tax=Aliiroseovarius zhejiangensis TaxID=1632025 RepID=A0ABQ3J4D8_9RHOB|nr:ureidoglycolate lyase [Aliiroseovarius zhejiangensis]GHF03186.1 ureidoglycolate lyase [Aliiroseovarius zhejiangensis]